MQKKGGRRSRVGKRRCSEKASTSFRPVGSGFSVYYMGWSRLLAS